ncbi:MAG TPA: transcriptional regulator HexR, partial [Halomonas sp.]|nr:transcriptional regulator HexR [Halomonas sp.]
MAHDLLDRLRERLEELNRSERKVANVILEDPTVATSLSIASLAQAASVSEPTV